MDHQKFLEVAIPTRNRVRHLDFLCAQIADELLFSPELHDVALRIYDNGSTDDTPGYLLSLQRPGLSLTTRSWGSDLGFAENYDRLVTDCQAKYVWVLGDDDMLAAPGALKNVVAVLRELDVEILVLDRPSNLTGQRPHVKFASLSDFVTTASRLDADVFRRMTWISSMIFSPSLYDSDFAIEKSATHYSHIYGLFGKVGSRTEVEPQVAVLSETLVKEQPIKGFRDPNFPNMATLEFEWARYYGYLARRFNRVEMVWPGLLFLSRGLLRVIRKKLRR